MPCLDLLIEKPTSGANPIDMNLSGHITAQNMTLRMAVIQMAISAHGKTAVNIHVPFLSRFQIHNSQSGNSFLTLPIKADTKSTVLYPDINFKSESVSQSFRINLYEADGKTEFDMTNLIHVELYFDYDQETLF